MRIVSVLILLFLSGASVASAYPPGLNCRGVGANDTNLNVEIPATERMFSYPANIGFQCDEADLSINERFYIEFDTDVAGEIDLGNGWIAKVTQDVNGTTPVDRIYGNWQELRIETSLFVFMEWRGAGKPQITSRVFDVNYRVEIDSR